MKEPRKIREGKIQGNYFLVPQAGHCYKVNPEEQRIVNNILIKYGKTPTKDITEKFMETGKKTRISVLLTVPMYLEIEETLGNYREQKKLEKRLAKGK